MSTASGDVVKKRRTGARRPIRPVTWAILGIIALAAFGSMVLVLTGAWPLGGGVSVAPPGSITPTSLSAEHVKVDKAGDPVRQADGQVLVKVKITNDNLKQSQAASGTPTPGAATPTAQPAKIVNASVKVLFYDKAATDPDKKIIGSAIGNYYNPQGLANGESATIDVVATGVGDFKDYQIFADTIFTNLDPVKTPQPNSSVSQPARVADITP